MKYYSIYCHNKQTENLRIINIFDDKRLAEAELSICLENATQYQNYYIVELSGKDFRTVVDSKLLSCCELVAQCLCIFDKCIFKRTKFNRPSFWYQKAIDNCKIGASILSFL